MTSVGTLRTGSTSACERDARRRGFIRYCWRFQTGDCEPGVFCPRGDVHLHVPECERFRKGQCEDGARCRFRHNGQPAWQYGMPVPEPQLAVGHIPVLRDEAVAALLGGVGGTSGLYVDGTFGRGGHSTEILRQLSQQGRLLAFDVDPSAIQVGADLAKRDGRFQIIHSPFGNLAATAMPKCELSGVLLDIGFSSPQIDQGHRGWSIMRDGPLDLRMNPQAVEPVSVWLQRATVSELAWIFRELGDEDDPILAQRLADAVLEQQRRCGAYTSTMQLGGAISHVIQSSCASSQRFHDAKLPMRALTAFVNQEMEQLVQALEGAFQRLCVGGRLVVITFKPSEEAIVQRFLRAHEDPPAQSLFSQSGSVGADRLAQLYPLLTTSEACALRRLCPPVYVSSAEVLRNRRSRSAALQVLEKVPRASPCVSAPGPRDQAQAGVAPGQYAFPPRLGAEEACDGLQPVKAPDLAPLKLKGT